MAIEEDHSGISLDFYWSWSCNNDHRVCWFRVWDT